MPLPNLLYALPDKMGGVSRVVDSLVGSSDGQAFAEHVLLTHCTTSREPRAQLSVACSRVEYSKKENLWAVTRRVAASFPSGPGVLVANDWLELVTVAAHDLPYAVVQILHGDYEYYYNLAVRHAHAVDAYVTVSERIRTELARRIPQREDDVFHYPFGVPLSPHAHSPTGDRLRILFVGRLTGLKGACDLPLIDQRLREQGIGVEWTLVGPSPDGAAFESRWASGASVRFTGPLSHGRVMSLYAHHDVFVLPSYAEGFPVSLVEAMGAGLVPVVSDLPSGIPELVSNGVTGFRVIPGNVQGFASAIARLHSNRQLLTSIGEAARSAVSARFEPRQCTRRYQDLYAHLAQVPKRHHRRGLTRGGRLDQRWLPNVVVRSIRALAPVG